MGFIRPDAMTAQQRQQALYRGREYANEHDGILPPTQFWDFLRERREINEARFDLYHPVVGRLLRREEQILACPELPPVKMPDIPVYTPCVLIPDPPYVPPVAVPEPSSLLLGVISIVAVIIAKRFT